MSEISFTITDAATVLKISPRRIRRLLKLPEFADGQATQVMASPFGPREVMVITAELLETLRQRLEAVTATELGPAVSAAKPTTKEESETVDVALESQLEEIERFLRQYPPMAWAETGAIHGQAYADVQRILEQAESRFGGLDKAAARIYLIALAHMVLAIGCHRSEPVSRSTKLAKG